jgi:hypothetical protein
VQQIPEGASYETVRFGVCSEVANLEADEAVAHFAAAYRAVVEEYQALFDQRWPLDRAWLDADARLKVLDRRLDAAVKGFRLELVRRSGNKQTGALFDLYFPTGLRAVTEAEAAVTEPALVGEIMRKLEANGGELDAAWRPSLAAAHAAVLGGAGARHGVELARQNLEMRLDAAVASLREARVVLHGSLRAQFKTDPSQAEAYFYVWRPYAARRGTPEAPPAA